MHRPSIKLVPGLVQQGQENDVKLQNEMLCKKTKVLSRIYEKKVDGSP